jgi:hypothetical protein
MTKWLSVDSDKWLRYNPIFKEYHRIIVRKTDVIGLKGKWVAKRVRSSGTETPIANPSI